MTDMPWMSLVGGVLIGLSALMLMLFTGKTAGISGIVNGVIERSDMGWRLVFLLAMALGGAGAVVFLGAQVPLQYNHSSSLVVLAGLLVGAGSRIGNGCTSGHGICGIGRFSFRSVVATGIFMAVAMITVWGMSV